MASKKTFYALALIYAAEDAERYVLSLGMPGLE